MMTGFQPHANSHRNGITLLEVLIAIGILAIGLSSVVAIIPAAQSQSARAVILDRAANMASNALADAATFGLFRPASLTTAPTSSTPVIIDPAAAAPYLIASSASFLPLAFLRDQGIYASSASGTASPAIHRQFTQSRDDLTFEAGAADDSPPINGFDRDGTLQRRPMTRSFEGRMSCLYCLRSGSPSGAPGTLSVVVFHARDPALLAVTGTMIDSQLIIPPANLGGREMREIVKPGIVLYDVSNRRLHQTTSAAVNSGAGTAFMTLSTGPLIATGTHTVQILPDSVGLAERPFVPEGVSPFTQ